MTRRVVGNIGGEVEVTSLHSVGCVAMITSAVARPLSSGTNTGLGHLNWDVPLLIASVLCTCVRGLDGVCDNRRSCCTAL